MRYYLWLTLCALPFSLLPAHAATNNGELPRAGAPRPLRLISPDGAPLSGLPSDVAWERRGNGVFFTLERGGTRNIWRAFPDPQDASRFPAWRALPITDLRAPSYAAQPCPLPGDRALACVSNVLAKAPQTAQIVRYDMEGARWTALSDGERRYDSPQISPDGTRVAFAGGPGLASCVFIASASNLANRVSPDVTAVAPRARRPIWLDDNSLLIENLAPDARGLYWTALANSSPRVIVGGGGEANALGESGIVFSAKTGRDVPPNLYLIARDGSGLRQLNETAGARRPAASPDGQTLAFDAPAPDGSTSGGRALWVLPLLRAERSESQVATNANVAAANMATSLSQAASPAIVPPAIVPPATARLVRALSARVRLIADDGAAYDGPFAQLSSVRAANEGVAIIGTMRASSSATAILEVGQGEKPRRWEKLDAPFPPNAPPLDTAGNRVLALWKPSPGARGVWTVRLSLSGLGGGAQSLLRVKLPLPIEPLLPAIPAVAAPATIEKIETPPVEPSDIPPSIPPLPRATPLPIPPEPLPTRGSLPLPPAATDDDLPTFPLTQAPTPAAIPPLAIPPTAPPPTAVIPSIAPPPIAIPPTAIAPIAIPPIASQSAAPAKTPTTSRILPVPIEPMRVPKPSVEAPTPPADDAANFGDEPVATGEAFVAQFNVSGTPARMEPREKARVTFWGLNRGSAPWETGSGGDNRVRVVARWVDFSTGTRRQWNYFWLPEAVAPGERTKKELELPAPSRPGKYKLIYGLVKLPPTGEFEPPAYDAPQEAWDGEFGAIAFAVEVAAKGE